MSTDETIDMITVSVAEYEALRRDAAPARRAGKRHTVFTRVMITIGVIFAGLTGMAVLGANLPDTATVPPVAVTTTPVASTTSTHPACPVGVIAGWTWKTTTYTSGSTCEATRTVNGVTISYVINADGTTVAGYTYAGACSDAGLDASRIHGGFFAGVDC